MSAERRTPPNCMQCEHFYVTHDPRFPYGCKAMGFKSKRSPQLDVRANSGEDCIAWTPKRRLTRR